MSRFKISCVTSRLASWAAIRAGWRSAAVGTERTQEPSGSQGLPSPNGSKTVNDERQTIVDIGESHQVRSLSVDGRMCRLAHGSLAARQESPGRS